MSASVARKEPAAALVRETKKSTLIRKTAFLVTVFAFALRSSFAQTPSDCTSLVDKAFEVTGTKQQIREMPQFIAQSAENARSWGADPAVIAHMKQAMQPDTLLRDLEHAFEHNCDFGSLHDVIARMDTPLGTRMRQIEVTEQNPKTREQRIVFFRDLRLHPPNDRRHDLVIEIDDATETSKSSWNMLVAMVKATGAKGTEGVDFAAEQQKYQPLLRTAAMYDFLFIYRNVDEAELGEYVDMLKTPAYRNFNHTLNQALLETIVNRTAQAIHEMSRGKASSKSGSRP